MMSSNNESGRSMVEMLGVLAIIGILSVGGISGIAYAMREYRVNKTYNLIEMAGEQIGNLFSWQRFYPDNVALICDNDIFASGTCTKSGNNAVVSESPLGTITVSASECEDKKCSVINLVLSGVESEACAKLAEKKWMNVTAGSCNGTPLQSITFSI